MDIYLFQIIKTLHRRLLTWFSYRDQKEQATNPCVVKTREQPAKRSFQTQLELAAKKLAIKGICSGCNYKQKPGPITLDAWETNLITKTGRWEVVEGRAFDHLRDLLTEAVGAKNHEVNQDNLFLLLERFNDLAENLIGQGSGPVAPTFDSDDWDMESRRGSWYVIEGPAFERFHTFCKESSKLDPFSEPPEFFGYVMEE